MSVSVLCVSCEIEPRWEIGNFIFVVNVGVGVTLCADTSLIIKTRREVFLFLEQKLETETMRCDSARRDPCQPNHTHPPVQIVIILSSSPAGHSHSYHYWTVLTNTSIIQII